MHLPTALVALGATLASALPQIEIKGNQFYFTGNGSEFKIRGLAYQPGGQSAFMLPGKDRHDPLSRPDRCRRDVPVIQSLGANVVRVYNLHADLNHDECVTMFNNAGIYLMIDVNSPAVNSHINEEDPKSTYHRGYLQTIFNIIDAFKGYTNVIGFFSGNEVINNQFGIEKNPPYLRAVVRDMRRYIARHSDRFIAVGYAATDTRSPEKADGKGGAGIDSVNDLATYLGCEDEEDANSRSDFFAVNIYSWCAKTDFQGSRYNELVRDFNETSLPVFWSEHGCNEKPRLFGEVPAMYGRDDMIETFAGGVVFEYSNEENKFGLVDIDDDGNVNLLEDFKTLSDQYNSVNWDKIKNIKESSFNVVPPTNCKDIVIKGKSFNKDFSQVPEPPFDADDLFDKGSGNKNVGKLLTDVSYEQKEFKIMDGKSDVTKDYSIVEDPQASVSDAKPYDGPTLGDGTKTSDEKKKDEPAAAGHVVAGAFAIVAPLVAGLFLF